MMKFFGRMSKKLLAGVLTAAMAVVSAGGGLGADLSLLGATAEAASTVGLDGTYYIRNVSTGKYLDVEGVSDASGANIHQWSFTGAANQQFKLVSDGNGYYSILTGITNYSKAIDIDNWGTSNGTNVIQWDYHGGDCQKFSVENVGGSYVIKTKITNNGKCLDVEGPSSDDGANVHQWDYYGGLNQHWALEPTGGSSSGSNTNSGLDGVYYLKNAHSGKYLDVAGISNANGANIQQWSYTGGDNQKFRLVSDGNGYYSLLTGVTGYTKAVDIDNWGTHDGANVIQWDYHGGDCQKFQLVQSGGGYIIKTKVSGNTKALDVDNASTNDGANVHQWDAHGNAWQCWYLEREGNASGSTGGSTVVTPPASSGSESVSANGMLQVNGNQIVNSRGEAFVLRGVSTHGISWFPQFVNESAFRSLRDDWGVNAIRLACYSQSGIYRGQTDIDLVMKGIDACIALDMYVIVDWHILNDNDPNMEKNNAKEFFRQIVSRYGNCPNIIYELCNEPNGYSTWANQIKPYCEELIPIIRNSCNNIIICGTGTWSQDVQDVIGNAINSNNIAYAVHFYANTHGQWLRDRITNARNNGLCVIISEFGTCDASGNGGFNADQSYVWLDYLESNKISYFNWSLCDKAETASILNPGSSSTGGWTDANLTESGRLYLNWVKSH